MASLIIELVVGKELFQAVKVETILYVFHVHFAEKVVVLEVAKPRYPPSFRVTRFFGIRHLKSL